MENGEEQQAQPNTNQFQHKPLPPAAQPPHHATRRERRRQKMMIFIAGGALLVALLVGGAYWLLLKGDDKQPAKAADNKAQPADDAPAPTPADPTPVTYKSTKLNIELTHRKDWALKEASDGEITVTSPRTTYTRIDGQAKTGVFTLKIRVGVPDAMKTTIEKAVAARDSEVIAYDDPPETQRYYTNLSYAGQKDVFNFFIVTGNTALKAGDAFAYALALDNQFYLLAGGYGADKDDTLAFDAVPPSAISDSVVQQAIAIVKSVKIF